MSVFLKTISACVLLIFMGFGATATDLKINDTAPLFKTKNQDGKDFDMSSRKGNWTVLYFYPKAGTPGCTKQACAFRDSINKIRSPDTDVFGISTNSVTEQAAFYKEHHLNFSLLADEGGKISGAYGTKMPLVTIAKRWTFIIDPQLKIRKIEKDVDPALDAEKVAAMLAELKKTK